MRAARSYAEPMASDYAHHCAIESTLRPEETNMDTRHVLTHNLAQRRMVGDLSGSKVQSGFPFITTLEAWLQSGHYRKFQFCEYLRWNGFGNLPIDQ